MVSDTSSPAGPQPPPAGSDTSPAPSGTPPPGPRRAQRGRPGSQPTPLPPTVAGLFADYQQQITRPGEPLDADTVRVYASRVRQYLAWLAAALDDQTVEGDPLTDPSTRDWAVRDYR